jgi:aspartate aminotransferase-like enzyme
VWRIGLMGYGSRSNNVLLLLAALEQCLGSKGGVEAANRAYTAA